MDYDIAIWYASRGKWKENPRSKYFNTKSWGLDRDINCEENSETFAAPPVYNKI